MTNQRTVTMVVAFLGLFALAGLFGTVWLIDHQRDASNIAIVAGMTGTALGALGAVLASTKTTEVPTPVTVTNPPDDAVQVEEVPKPKR